MPCRRAERSEKQSRALMADLGDVSNRVQIPHAGFNVPPQKVLLRVCMRLFAAVYQVEGLLNRPNIHRPAWRLFLEEIRSPVRRFIKMCIFTTSDTQLHPPIEGTHKGLYQAGQDRIPYGVVITGVGHPRELPACGPLAEKVVAFVGHEDQPTGTEVLIRPV